MCYGMSWHCRPKLSYGQIKGFTRTVGPARITVARAAASIWWIMEAAIAGRGSRDAPGDLEAFRGCATITSGWAWSADESAVPLFLVGVTLAYWSLGRSIHYLPGLTPSGVADIISVDQYMSFVMTMMLAFGLAFAVPLLIIMLNLAGILTHQRFRKWRPLMLFAVFLIAGVANPSPDPLTMLILGGGCAALGEAAEFIAWSNDRRRARLHPTPTPAWPTTSYPPSSSKRQIPAA